MIKINLLPAYVLEQRQVRVLAAIFAVVLIGLIVVLTGISLLQIGRVRKWDGELKAIEPTAAEVERLKSEIQKKQTDLQPIEQKLNLIIDAIAHNKDVADALDEIAKFTYRGIYFKELSIKGDTLQIVAHAESATDAGRFYLNFLNCPSIETVSVSGIPGVGAATVTPTGGMGPMMGGMGMGPMMSGMGKGPGMGMGMGPMGKAGGPPGMGMPGMGMPGMRPPGMGSVPGTTTTQEEGGFDFTILCKLYKPMNAPQLAAPAPAAEATMAAAPMGGMGMPGMGSMMPGMMAAKGAGKAPGMGPMMGPGAAGAGAPAAGGKAATAGEEEEGLGGGLGKLRRGGADLGAE